MSTSPNDAPLPASPTQAPTAPDTAVAETAAAVETDPKPVARRRASPALAPVGAADAVVAKPARQAARQAATGKKALPGSGKAAPAKRAANKPVRAARPSIQVAAPGRPPPTPADGDPPAAAAAAAAPTPAPAPAPALALALALAPKAPRAKARQNDKPAKQAKTAQVAEPAKASKAAKQPAMQAVPSTKTGRQKEKLVRDSFTMPRSDFELIQQLKDRAMGFRHAAKKSELLRAGLHALMALDPAALQQLLATLPALKSGRPRKGA